MTDLNFLTQKPYNLDRQRIAWVEKTLGSMSTQQKAAHLFVLAIMGNDDKLLEELAGFQPAGITKMFGPDRAAELGFMRAYEKSSTIPPLVTADLEGSRMSLPFGTQLPNPLGLAAIDDVELTRQAGNILAREGRAAGVTWSFTPVIDINQAFRSAIVGTRSFGSDVEKIARHALTQIEAFQASGVAATVKHWPGEGYDDRDQHLVTTVNPLSMDDWHQTYGRIYKSAFDAGVMAIMSAHIALPAFMRQRDPDCGRNAFMPASLNYALNTTLLREELGFNGIVTTDATTMAGFGDWGTRNQTLPQAVASGCDVILFSDDWQGDLHIILKAIEDGRITPDRLDQANARILGVKAAQGLIDTPVVIAAEDEDQAFCQPQDLAAAQEMFARMPTLVKDTQNVLPISRETHRRVLVFTQGIVNPFMPEGQPFELTRLLEAEGFDVTVFTPGLAVAPEDYDLVLYLMGHESLLTRSHIFIDWMKLTGGFDDALRRYWHDVPTAMISFGHPYHLYDAPAVKTYINAYSTLDGVQKAVVEGLLGRAPFAGTSPVDPFCGVEWTRY